MSWQPLVRDSDQRTRVLQVIAELATEVDRSGIRPMEHALLRTYLAQDDSIVDTEQRGAAALASAVGSFTEHGVGLAGGAAGVGWTVSHVASGEVADEACSRIDQLFAHLLTPEWNGDFDLLVGLVGFGLYALDRGEAGDATATRVLDHLERLAKPRAGGLAWFTSPELLPDNLRARTPEGHWDLGVAHGTPGVVALLARYIVAGVEVDRAGRLLEAAVTFVRAGRDGGTYPMWQGPDGDAGSRLAWCYGDLGVSTALLGAGIAAERDDWRNDALDLARSCARRPLERAKITTPGLCHGAFGAMHIFNRIHQVSGEAAFADAARRWFEHGLATRDAWPEDPSMLEGRAGIALALHAAISEVDPSWDRMMLLDLA